MKNVKKAMAMVLSMALAASTLVVGAAYDDVPQTHENKVAIDLLGDLGVMVGDADSNNFRPEGTLKRSEAAAIVYRLRTGNTKADAYAGNTKFSDVSSNHWACGYINYAVSVNIISGYPDGTFKPDNEVTYAEFATMLVRALNKQEVESVQTWNPDTGVLETQDIPKTTFPAGYLAIAEEEGITNDIPSYGPNEPVVRATVAQMSYNTIFEAEYLNEVGKPNNYGNDASDIRTIASAVFKIEDYKGILGALEDYNLYGDKTGDDQFLLYDKDGSKISLPENEFEGLTKDMLGQEVKVYIKTSPPLWIRATWLP
ncbi:MAG: S-layer homology domain-containing protein [Eubacteriales bacterium]|jgi:hypothetical protein